MANRLRNIPVLNSPNGKRYKINAFYPEIELNEDDIYIESTVADRYDILALEFYNDPKLWWIIAAANGGFKGTLNTPVGIQLRIPVDKDKAVKDFEELNN